MNRQIKKLFSFMLILAITVGLLPTLSFSTGAESENAYAVTGGNIYFDPDTATVYACDESVTEAVIPDTINGIKVLEIGDWAFENCKALTTVSLPKAITYIGDCSFKGCESLKEFTVPARTRYVGMLVFEGCTSLEAIGVAKANTVFSSVEGILLSRDKSRVICCPEGKKGDFTVPKWVKKIEPSAFYNCKNLDSIIFDEAVILSEIGDYAFQGCSAIRRITLPESVTVIGEGAFMECEDLRTVSFSKSLTEIKGFAFMNCPSLKSATVPSTVTKIGQFAFSGCSAMTKAVLSDEITVIENGTFSGCSSLSEVTLPAALTAIKTFAFSDCAALESIVLPESLTEIGAYAFTRCNAMTEFSVAENNTAFASENGILYSKDKTVLLCCPAGIWGAITIPDGVTTLAKEAFYNCEGLFRVTIPESVTEIGDWAFENCESLAEVRYNGTPEQWEQIKIGEGNDPLLQAKRLEAYAVEGGNLYFDPENGAIVTCQNTVTKAEIPAQIRGIPVTKINMFAFDDCDLLTSLTIPESVTEIESNPFSGKPNLTEVQVSPENPAYTSVDGILYTKALDTLIFCPAATKGTVTVPEGVREIGESAFFGCENLTGVTLPDSLQIIRNSAFASCTMLEDIILPRNLQTIEIFTFAGCESLKTMTIPASVTFIENAFPHCGSLQAINVDPENQNYASIDGVLYNKDQTVLILCPEKGPAKVTVPNGVTEIGYAAFSNCSNLKSVNLPDSLTTIGVSAFSECPALEEISIPDGVTVITYNTFFGCRSLTEIILPANLQGIGYSAFEDCISLLTVKYPGSQEDWEAIEIAPENNMLTVAEIVYDYVKSIPGDLNGDGEVNAADGALMARYLAKWTVAIDEKAADINGNGEINAADGALLSRHLAKWDIEYFQ